jgi:serine/threonine-protein kinase
VTGFEDRLAAALADRYAIERKLGEGGMAVVYLARDLKHDRPVAVKILHPDLAASIGADRFLREIQITARLSHPHILPLYDSGNAGGFLYYVMPYVEGETLSGLMEREKQLSFEEAIRITREVAEALAYAHSFGLVHRDIKPDNVLLSGGHAVVADFGIARAVSEAGGEKLTQTGMAVGTPAYMSPEQAAGESEVSARSDIYSLGCVLYQMVVGQVPFTGSTPMAVMARHTMDAVPAPHIQRPTIPDDLEDIIYCAMAKAPADRYRTAQEMVEALNAVGTGAAPRRLSVSAQRRARAERPGDRPFMKKAAIPAGIALAAVGFGVVGWWWLGGRGSAEAPAAASLQALNHIAVLYFDDRSAEGRLDYLSAGLTEGLIQQLTDVEGLEVVSTNGVRPYRGASVSTDSLRKALGVGTLVEGSVAQDGERLRVGVSLVDAASGDVIADTTIDRARTDIFALQDELAQDVSEFLRMRLGTAVTLREQRSRTRNPAAWEAAQQASHAAKDAETLAATGDAAAVERQSDRADSLFAKAAALDGQWPEPLAERGWLAFGRARAASDLATADRRTREALTHAAEALRRAPRDAKALDLRGTVRYWRVLVNLEPDPRVARAVRDSAERDLRGAIEIDPHRADALTTLSHLLMNRSQTAEGKLYAQRAYEADPYLRNTALTLWRLFSASLDLEDPIQATHWCDELGRRFPDDPRSALCHVMEQTVLAARGRVDAAWSAYQRYLALSPASDSTYNGLWGRMMVALVLARAGLADSARHTALAARGDAALDPARELAYVEGAVRAWTGDKDEAVRQISLWLAANPQGRENLALDESWYWRPIRDYPPYRALLGVTGPTSD